MIFVGIMEYAGRELIAQVRPSHRAYMHDLIAQGKVIAAGSFAPDGDGGLFLYEAPNQEVADRMVAEDPYVKGGAILKYRLREYEIHGANAALLRVSGN